MKTKIFFLLALAAIAVSCTNDEPKSFKIDPLATVNIKPAVGTPLKVRGVNADAVQHLTALQIVEQATVIHFDYNNIMWERGFDVLQKDLSESNPRLMMWATDIVNAQGDYVPDFIESTNCLLIHWHDPMDRLGAKDTIAYIPNKVLSDAQKAIKTAYDKQDAAECVRLFNTAFTFTPITGAEWRGLKAAGQN